MQSVLFEKPPVESVPLASALALIVPRQETPCFKQWGGMTRSFL